MARLFAMLLQLSLIASQASTVRGDAVDFALAAVPNCTIRLLPQDGGVAMYRAQSSEDGRFEFTGIDPDAYRMALSCPGFREKFIRVTVISGVDVDLGKIPVEVSSCDSPGINCLTVGGPIDDKRVSAGEIKIERACAVDLDRSKVKCTVERDAREPNSDFWLDQRAGQGIFLEPRNGAKFAEPNASAPGCAGALFQHRLVRIDGLGKGSDLCVRTNRGRQAEIFFVEEILPDALVIHIVTRKQ